MEITKGLLEAMRELEDKSLHDGYWYSISEAMTVMVCGMLCHLQTMDDIHEWTRAEPTKEFFRNYFGIGKIPCRAQFYNIIGCVDSEKFTCAFTNWMGRVVKNVEGKTIAIDGKTICSTDKLSKSGNALHIASAIISEYGLIIGTRECETKTGEITAFRELVDLLDVAGAVVVADALHCTRKSAEAVVEAKADYLLAVKDNTPGLKENIALYIHNETLENCETIEKNGGRIERRTAYVSNEIDWLDGKDAWKGLTCIGAIHTEFEKDGKTSSEWHYYISSAPLTAKSLLHHARLEWGVESMHWLLDVHFNEDRTRVWDMNIQKTLNLTRKIALNLAKIFKNSTSAKIPISGVLKRNLFDVRNLAAFLDFFSN